MLKLDNLLHKIVLDNVLNVQIYLIVEPPKMVKKYMRHGKDGKHAKGLNLSCDNCGMGIDYKHFEGKNPKWIV